MSDLRRDLNPLIKWFMYLAWKPKAIRPGRITSMNASYTPTEIEALLNTTSLRNAEVRKTAMGYEIIGKK